MRRHIDELERRKVLKQKHGPNCYVPGYGMRRTKTYVLNREALGRSESYEEWARRNQRSAPPRFKPRPVRQVEAPPASEPEAPRAAPPAPAPIHRSTHRPVRQLTSRQGRDLVAGMMANMQGITRKDSDGIAVASGPYELAPDDRRYRAPMDQEHALTAVCMVLGIPYDAAVEHLKLCRWRFGEERDE